MLLLTYYLRWYRHYTVVGSCNFVFKYIEPIDRDRVMAGTTHSLCCSINSTHTQICRY